MIKPLNKYDTRAVIKITDWLEQETLTKLKQNSTVDGEYFIREALIGGELCKLVKGLQLNGELKFEVIKTFHCPSEKLCQVMKEEETLETLLSDRDKLKAIRLILKSAKGNETTYEDLAHLQAIRNITENGTNE